MTNGLPEGELVGNRVFGVDVARYGDDETAVSERIGRNVLRVDRIGHQDTQTTALRVSSRMEGGALAVVDVIGVGAGVVDRLRELNHEVVAFNAAERTDMTDAHGEFTFPNVRSAAWWNLREMLDPSNSSAVAVSLPDDEILAAELSSPRWRILAGAKIQVEPKEDTKKRIRRSPDSADAVVMSLYYFGVDSGNAVVLDWGGSSEYTLAYAGQVFTSEDRMLTESAEGAYVYSGLGF